MRKSSRSWESKPLACALLLTFSPPGIAQVSSHEKGNTAEPAPRITVFVYNYAGVPTHTLSEAERTAARILHEADVDSLWCHMSPATTEPLQEPTCGEVSGPAKIRVRILPRLKVVPGKTHNQTLGFAVGSMATVSFYWVEGLAAQHQVASESQILGHAIAHELGHILLHTTSHAPQGIMRADWGRKDLQTASLGRLGFTPPQAELLRAGMRARLRQVDVPPIAEINSAR